MKRIALTLALAFAAISAAAQSTAPAAVCPWLTQGTAARVLGGEVSIELQISDAGEGFCRFLRTQDARISLRIEVGKAAPPPCGPQSTALRGIGNEAWRCKVASPDGLLADRIAGRVRNLYFTLVQTTRGPAPPRSSDDADDPLEQAAETVAGNLF